MSTALILLALPALYIWLVRLDAGSPSRAPVPAAPTFPPAVLRSVAHRFQVGTVVVPDVRIERVLIGGNSFVTILSDGSWIEWTGRLLWDVPAVAGVSSVEG